MIKLGQQKISRLIIYYTLFFLSGILMGVTVAPIGAWFLAWIALVPLWLLVIKYTSKIDPPGPPPPPPAPCPALGYRLSRSCSVMDYRDSSYGLVRCSLVA